MDTIKIGDIDLDLKNLGVVNKPNDDQIEALCHLSDFLKSDKKSTVLSGSAGTGKTFCMNIFLKYIDVLKKYEVVLAAPTHKAKLVLKRLSENKKWEVTTLHKLLGLRPDVNILDFDAKDLKFIESPIDFFHIDTIYIIDESSMINDFLFDIIVEKLTKKGNKVIFIGDPKQLKPVKQIEISKVFTATDFKGYELTKIMRQVNGSVLLETLEILREQPIKTFHNKIGSNSSLVTFDDPGAFVSNIKDKFMFNSFYSNPLKYKILTYTNKRVASLNNITRKVLGRTEVFERGDLLMGYDNFVKNNKIIIYNSNDYIIENCKKEKINIPFYNKVDGYLLRLIDPVDKTTLVLPVVDPNIDPKVLEDLTYILEDIRLNAVNSNSSLVKKNYWSAWYTMKESFTTMVDLIYQTRIIKRKVIDYGYSISTHKSQGSSYNDTFIDMKDILKCPNPDDIRPLQYVAVSRAKNNVYIFQ